MNEFTSRQYSTEEVNRIIRRALKLAHTDTIRHQDLIETAQEIGIDRQILETAISQEHQESKKKRRLLARRKRRKVGFYWHLWSFLTVNGGLFLVNYFIPGPWWFQWSFLGWGIGLAFHFKAVYFTSAKKMERQECSVLFALGS
jgi:hypothetical protein